MADPLTLLRQFNIQKKNIVEREDQVIFDTISFLKTAKTNYVIGRWLQTFGDILTHGQNGLKEIKLITVQVYLNMCEQKGSSQNVAFKFVVKVTREESETVLKSCRTTPQQSCLSLTLTINLAAGKAIGTLTTPKEYYTLEALLFFLKKVNLSHPIYVQRAGRILVSEPQSKYNKAANVPVVRFPDRKDLLAYLNGEKETSANIDKSAPLELPLSRTASVGVKRAADDANTDGSKKHKMEDSQKQDIQEWLSMKLQEKKEGAITTERILKDVKSGLNEVMSIDRIAEIKRKIMTRKRATIKGDDDYNPEVPQVEPEQVSLAMNFIVDTDNEMTKDILGRERQLRTRTSVLQSNGKQFLKNIGAILNSIKAQEEGKGVQQQATPAVTPVVKEVVKKPAPVNRYDRYDQERFDSQKDTEGFKIDTMATFQGLSLQSVKEGKSQRRSIPSPSPHVAPNKSPRHSSGSQSPGKPQKRESKTPIIIVPAATTALITLLNCKDLLQDYKFVSVEEKKRLGTIKENEVLVQRKKEILLNGQMQNVTVPFRIVDQPLKLKQNEWNRVAAVFVQGPTWQFKGWPWLLPDGSPTDIFTKVRAFYVKYDDMKTDPNVAKWDVQILTIHRNRRHMDRACVLKFWETLEKFLVKNKPNLRF